MIVVYNNIKRIRCKCGSDVFIKLDNGKVKCNKCGAIDTLENNLLESSGINKKLEEIKKMWKNIK